MRVDIHRGSNVGVPQKFLLNLHVSPVRVQQSRIRVAKCVPLDSTDARLLCGWPEVISHKFVRPPRLAGKGTRVWKGLSAPL